MGRSPRRIRTKSCLKGTKIRKKARRKIQRRRIKRKRNRSRFMDQILKWPVAKS